MTESGSWSSSAAVDDDIVMLVVPAASSYLGVLRTATAGLAARLEFTLDEIEDLRIAVDEACTMLLALSRRDAELTCQFTVDASSLTVRTSVPAAAVSASLPSKESFAWQVLRALTDGATAYSSGPSTTIQLTKHRPSRQP